MVKVKDTKNKKNGSINKISTEEKDVYGEDVSQTLSASNVSSMTIMKRSDTRINASVVTRSDILLKIVDLMEKERRPSS